MNETKTVYQHFFKEKKAILEASLQLINEGRFHHSGMSEIAFQARLAQSTTLQFYPNRSALIQELKKHVTLEIHSVIRHSLLPNDNAKSNFQKVWQGLYKFYVANPATLRFIDQSTSTLGNSESAVLFLRELNSPIAQIWLHHPLRTSPEKAAAITQANIIALAKLGIEHNVSLDNQELTIWSSSAFKNLSA